MAQVVLVTGGAGYVGSHACKALARAGYIPVTYDNLERGHEWAVKWGPLEKGDLNDRARLDEVLARHRPAGVLHFAGYINVGESVRRPGIYYHNNVTGTLVLLEAVRAAGISSFVFSSTCAVYGMPRSLPLTEDHPRDPINPYGTTKYVIERVLEDYRAAHGLRFYALRYFNAAGADPDGDTGEAHDPETHLIPLVLDVAAGKTDAINILGDDYDTPDGTCIRDYIHVTDLAEAHVLALRKLLDGGTGGFLNLGTGTGHSVREVIDTVAQVTGRKIATRIAPRRAGDPAELVAGPARARAELAWQPQKADIAVQIADAWRWHGARR